MIFTGLKSKSAHQSSVISDIVSVHLTALLSIDIHHLQYPAIHSLHLR